MNRIGIVVIGRNEGDRLRRCLESAQRSEGQIVYVDSGSTDGSIETAKQLGVDVVHLDMTQPFTAARARNAGLSRLDTVAPDGQYVQFVDGDCELTPDWIPTASRILDSNPKVAAVAGRLMERHPDASIYNRLCSIEWEKPAGDVKACGGIAMMRVLALHAVGGFNENLIAGEEPELCVRLRRTGWNIRQETDPMGWHDAGMTRFSQWWKRAKRSGHAYAEGVAMHGCSPERHNVREFRSILIWGTVVPAAVVGATVIAIVRQPAAWPVVVVLIGGYLFLVWRVYGYRLRFGNSRSDAALYAAFCVLAKFPQTLGVGRYWFNRLAGRGSQLIEYKRVSSD